MEGKTVAIANAIINQEWRRVASASCVPDGAMRSARVVKLQSTRCKRSPFLCSCDEKKRAVLRLIMALMRSGPHPACLLLISPFISITHSLPCSLSLSYDCQGV
ncbi:hypothetical protein EYF80_005642 [Liparis tanakae]|uniref:Uncharacterized protein n=1 Tax=Liparis tanakae TaxID=230148 RepID=A0A4Z2J1H8_9TELE|nr:hypothetical protein EYF80_005642 [Liparis tanakae]